MRNPLPAMICVTLLAAGCSALPGTSPQSATTTARFDPAEVAWAMQPGSNTLRGSAAIRGAAREPRTCAGAVVAVLPDSAYTRERMRNLYGSLERGSNDMAPEAMRRIDPADPGYVKAVRQSICDIHGGFVFKGLADGTWYVTTSVVWRTRGNDPRSQTGAGLMQRVRLSGGRTVSVSLAP